MSSRRVGIVALLLMACGGGWMGFNRLNTVNPGPDGELLTRRIASVHLHNVPADEAIRQLQDLIGVTIVTKWDIDRYQRFWLDFDDIAVCDLLRAVIEQLRSPGEFVEFGVANHSIVIAPHASLALSVRVYDVAGLRKDAPPSTRPSGEGDEIVEGIRFVTQEQYWRQSSLGSFTSNVPTDLLQADSARLLILQTSAAHKEIAELLGGVDQARSDGTGPCMSRSRVLVEDSMTRIIRFYDVRDMTGRVEYLPFEVWNRGYLHDGTAKKSGTEFLASAISIRCSPESWMSGGQIGSMAGRLIIEQTPRVHAQIREMLADIRAGKSVEGFRLVDH